MSFLKCTVTMEVCPLLFLCACEHYYVLGTQVITTQKAARQDVEDVQITGPLRGIVGNI